MESDQNSIYPTRFTRNVRDYHYCRTCHSIGPMPHQSKTGLACYFIQLRFKVFTEMYLSSLKDDLIPLPWVTAFSHMDVKITLKKSGADLAQFISCYFIYGDFLLSESSPSFSIQNLFYLGLVNKFLNWTSISTTTIKERDLSTFH